MIALVSLYQKGLRLGLALLMVAGLAGCIDADYAIDFAADQSANVRATFTIASVLYNAMRQQDPGSMDDLCISDLKVAGDDRIQHTHILQSDNHVCEVRLYIADVSHPSPDVLKALSSLDMAITPASAPFQYRVTIKTSYGGQMDDDSRVLLAGHYLTARVTAPRVIASNAQVSTDYKATALQVPMASVLSDPDGAYRFAVDVQAKPAWWPF